MQSPRKETYDISIVMAVYNAELFIKEAVDSLIAQDFGFERIQVILVDDGSQDNSAQICDEYANKYSNVLALHKDNGGAASARAYGMKFIQGKYVNFVDSDDKLSSNTCSAVYAFFEEHEEEIDLVSIPIIHFEAINRPHLLNYKFERGNRVIDLEKEPDKIQLSMSSTFVKWEAAQDLQLDTRLSYAEDAKWVVTLLMKKKKLGVVKNARYYYRRHSSGGESALQKSTKNPAWYLPTLKHFTYDLIQESLSEYGAVPRFVQYTLAYELQWHIKDFDMTILSSNEIEEYRTTLFNVIKYIDDDIILAQKQIPVEYKLFLLRHKHNTQAQFAFQPSAKFKETLTNNLLIDWNSNFQKDIHSKTVFHSLDFKYMYQPEESLFFGNVIAFYDGNLAAKVSQQSLKIHFINIDNEVLTIEGAASLLPDFISNLKLFAVLDGQAFLCEETVMHQPKLAIGEEILHYWGFKITIPLPSNKKSHFLTFIYKWTDSVTIKVGAINLGQFVHLTNAYDNSHYIDNGWLITATKAQIKFVECSDKLAHQSELRLIKEIWKKNLVGGRKSLVIRTFVRFMKRFKHRPLLLISDRIMKADDNGEAFFRYMQKEHKEIKSYFVISKKSVDYERIKKIGPVLDDQSMLHKLFFFLADCIISSQADVVTINPFHGYDAAYKDLFQNVKFVFLQHGITKDDISGWLNKYNKDIRGFITAAKREYQSILDGDYFYTPNEVWLTGFPRFDRLYHDEKKLITIMPTWRKNLTPEVDFHTGIRPLSANFTSSDYFRFYTSLLNDNRLLVSAEKYGYKICFLPHPNLQAHIELFACSPKVKIIDFNSKYRDIYAWSDLVVTDYSSAVFDFAYLRKPVVYCQFDAEEFFSGSHTYTKGYFDYEEDGFGEVEYTLENTVNRIIEYMENGCQLKAKYRKRIDDFFAFNDTSNCERVYQKIQELLP